VCLFLERKKKGMNSPLTTTNNNRKKEKVHGKIEKYIIFWYIGESLEAYCI
jgi:hypothetical protein